jgi:hypothetical protein
MRFFRHCPTRELERRNYLSSKSKLSATRVSRSISKTILLKKKSYRMIFKSIHSTTSRCSDTWTLFLSMPFQKKSWLSPQSSSSFALPDLVLMSQTGLEIIPREMDRVELLRVKRSLRTQFSLSK